MPGFLAELGLRVLANGYNVIPIKPGAKYPVIKGWQNTRTTREDIGYWLGNGHADAGIGITTGKVSFVDCDIPDEIDARAMEEFIILEVGFAPNWSAKLEYLYADFGNVRTTWLAPAVPLLPPLPALNDDARLTMNVVRAGVNYRF